MTIRTIQLKNFEWIDMIDPSEKEVREIIETNDFHILDQEAILEENQRARVDMYEKYLFIVLHFPKYDAKTFRYIHNEFNIFLTKKSLITIRFFQTSSIDRVFQHYRDDTVEKEKMSPGYVLYDIIEAMLDKMFGMLDKFHKDLRIMERGMFGRVDDRIIQTIMIKKRNAITLKHMIYPQIPVLKILELRTNELFKDAFELYFENLQDKLERINSEILLIQENLDSMEDTLKSVFDMQMNNSIRYLTIFSAFMLPLTFITGFFGMNIVSVPFSDWIMWGSIFLTIATMLSLSAYLIRKGKI